MSTQATTFVNDAGVLRDVLALRMADGGWLEVIANQCPRNLYAPLVFEAALR